MEDTYDEWISKIVPIELFSVKAEEFLYIGKEYGFFFDYDWDENEYLIYLILHDIDVETSGQIMRKITPLFYEKYLFEDGKVTIPSDLSIGKIKDENGNFYHQKVYLKYSERNFLYLQNIGFSGSLYNLNDVNYGEEGYQADQDNGGYFIGGSYLYNGIPVKFEGDNCAAELFVIALGTWGGKLVGYTISAIEAIIAIKEGIYARKSDYYGRLSNEMNLPFSIEEIERSEQIKAFGQLLKEYVSVLDTDSDKNSVLFEIDSKSYAQSTMYYNFANQSSKQNTGFVGRIKFDIVESTLLHGIQPLFKNVESVDFRYDLYNGSRIELIENETTDIYTFPERENNLTFTAPENGVYTFESLGKIRSKFNADKGQITNFKLNQKLVVELRKGEKFDFTSKNLYNQKGVYQIRTEFTPQQIEAEETKTLTVKAGESEFFAFDNTDGAGFNYSLDENGNYSISVAYEDRNNVLETVSMLNMKSGAIAHCESGKYIIKITNNGDKDAKLEFNVSHGSALDIGQAYELEVGRNALYKLGEPKASSIVKFATVSEIPLKISLLDEQFNVIIESDKITDAEIKSVIDENKTYYLYIENDRESAAKIALEVAYDLFKLTLGNNELAGKHLSSNIYELSLTSDARITISASHNIEYSVYDEKWELLELQDGAYVISKDAKYFIVARGEESAFNFDISLECTEDLEGMIGADEYCYIRYIPTKTDYYDVSGVEVFEWFDEHLRTFSDKMEEGSVYYLKITGEENTPYNISIQRRATLIPLRSSFDATNKLYFIEIEESGAYAITTWISNGVTGTFDILDWENNLISADNKAGEKHIAHFEKGLYYIDMKTNDGVTMLINAHNSDNAQLNNTLIEGVNHNVEIKSNTDNTFIVNASASSEYYLMLTYVSTRLQIFITVTDSSLNEIPFEELTLQPTEQGKRYGVKLKLEEGKTYFISIYYTKYVLGKRR